MKTALALALTVFCLGLTAPGLAQLGQPLGGPAPPMDAQSTSGPYPPSRAMTAQTAAFAMDSQTLIAGTPAYLWTNGCGPTALGMVVGYWDARGFGNLVPGSAVTQSSAVNTVISSPGSYSDYGLPVDYYPNMLTDKSAPPPGDEHSNDCLADFMSTSRSVSGNYYGWSWFSDMPKSFQSYAHQAEPTCAISTANVPWSSLSWTRFRAEIDANRPAVFLVDSDSDGGSDHFVTVIGYGVSAGQNMYACYNTWDRSVHWYRFQAMASGQAFGIYGATFFDLARPADQAELAKRAPDGTAVKLYGVPVTRPFTSYFYVQDTDGSCGIKVSKLSHGMSAGMLADISGTTATGSDGEKYVSATTVTATGSLAVAPVGLQNKDLGGGDWLYNAAVGAGQKGILGATGLNNTGLLCSTTGRVTYSTVSYFYIDDGSAFADGSGRTGVRVAALGLTSPSLNSYVRVTGISSCYKDGTGYLRRLLQVRYQSDITPLE